MTIFVPFAVSFLLDMGIAEVYTICMMPPGWLILDVVRFVVIVESSPGLRGEFDALMWAVRRWYDAMGPIWVGQSLLGAEDVVRFGAGIERIARAVAVALRAEREG